MFKEPLNKLFIKDNFTWYTIVIAASFIISSVFYRFLFVNLQDININKVNVKEVKMIAYENFYLFLIMMLLMLCVLYFIHNFFIFKNERSPERTLFIAHLPYNKKEVFLKIWWLNYIVYFTSYLVFSVLSITGIYILLNKYIASEEIMNIMKLISQNLLAGILIFTLLYSILMFGQSFFSAAISGSVFTFVWIWFSIIYIEGISILVSRIFFKTTFSVLQHFLDALTPYTLYVSNLIREFYKIRVQALDNYLYDARGYFISSEIKYYTNSQNRFFDGEFRMETFKEHFDVLLLRSEYYQYYLGVIVLLIIGIVICYFTSVNFYSKNEFSKNNSSILAMFKINKAIIYFATITGLGLIPSLLKVDPMESAMAFGVGGLCGVWGIYMVEKAVKSGKLQKKKPRKRKKKQIEGDIE